MAQSLQQINEIHGPDQEADIADGGAAFPKDRSIHTAARNAANASLTLGNSRFGDEVISAIDIASFASLFIFARMHNLAHVSAWSPNGGATTRGERVAAAFPPNTTLLQAFTSFKANLTSTPDELIFAVLRENQSVDDTVSLTFHWMDGGARLTLTSERAPISTLTARDFLEKISLVANALAQNPNILCSELSLVTEAARSLLPDLSRAIEPKRFETVPDVFLRVAKEHPDQAAICTDDESYSYGELARVVRHIATRLVEAGVRPGDIVAVSGFMSMGTVAAMIATMAAGGVMVTVDHALPQDRQRLILDISQPRFIINVGPQGQQEDCLANEVAVSDRLSHAQIAALPDCAFTPPSLSQDALAYIFFTSGSSGVPKGVQGVHLGLAHFLDWQRSNFPIGPGDRAAQITALSFDVVLRDVLFPLTSGACLYLLGRGAVLDARRFLRWVSEKQITVMHCVPSLMKAWLKGVDDQQPFASIKLVFFAGEPLTENLLRGFLRAAHKNTRIVNLYGPTETTLAKLAFEASRIEPGVQPVGTPQPGVDVAIVRDRQTLCGLWEIGEIAIRTPYRSRGYLANEELTRQAFLPNPFTDDASDLIYFTGDLGRLRPDGLVEIFGRVDSQVKIRGVRIEPNEIESHILKLPGVRDAAVTVHAAGTDEKMLAALIVSDPPVPRDQHVEFGRSIREALKTQLVDAMVPSSIIVVEALPYLPNGKLDRKQLTRICQAELDTEAAAPEEALDETERRLLDAFRLQLGSKTVTLDSSFESLGGDSLSYVTVYLALEDILGEVPAQWTSMSVRELGGLTHHPAGVLFKKVESAMLLRALAITAVVAQHFQMINLQGTTSMLMFVSGLMFGNIQAKEMIKSPDNSSIFRFIKRLLTQYFVVLAPFIAKTFIEGAPAWAALFLFSDIVDWKYAAVHRSETLWYIHCLVHILLAYIAIYNIATKFRKGEKAVLLALSICCAIGLVGRDVAPYLLDPHFHSAGGQKYSIFYYLPTSHIATFALAALSTMVTGVRKLFLAAVLVCYALAGLSGYGQFVTAFLVVGGLWVMFAPKVTVPRLIAPVLYNVGGASMFIYLLHNQLKNVTDHMSKVPVAFEFAGAIAIGVAAWRLWNLGAQTLPQMLTRIGAWRNFRGGLNLRMASVRGSVPRPPV